jgi:hypothetical protein
VPRGNPAGRDGRLPSNEELDRVGVVPIAYAPIGYMTAPVLPSLPMRKDAGHHHAGSAGGGSNQLAIR